MSQSFNIFARWSADTSDAGAIGSRLLETFSRLEPIAPVMRNWVMLDGPRGVPLKQVETRMAAFVRKHVIRDDYGKAERVSGYGIWAYGWEVPETWDARTVHIHVNAGSTWWNEVEFEIGDSVRAAPDLSLITYPIFKDALEVFAAAWPLPWALAYTFNGDAPPIDARANAPLGRWSPFEIAWIAYLSAPLAKGLVAPAEIVAQPTPGGGVLLSAAEVTIDQMNPEHMRRSRVLEQIMRERIGVGDLNLNYRPAPHPPRAGPY
jgi:hypothetical protein